MRRLCRTAIMLSCLAAAPDAFADTSHLYKDIKITPMLTFQHILTDNRDLGQNSMNTGQSYSAQPRVRVDVPLGEKTDLHTDVRALIIDSENGVGAEDDTGISNNTGEGFVELREAWLERKALFGHIPLSLQIGR